MKKSFLSKPSVIRDSLALVKEADVENNIRVLPYLRDLIPPLTDEETAGLEDSIRREGVKDALTLWETTLAALMDVEESLIPTGWREEARTEPNKKIYILVDGHNRYQVARKLNEPFRYSLREFGSLEEVRDYMIKFQLSRRNLTPLQASSMRGLLYLTLKREQGRPRNEVAPENNAPDLTQSTISPERSTTTVPQSTVLAKARLTGEEGKTADRLASEFGVSEKTIKRDADFRRGLEQLTPPLQHQVTSGKIKVKKSEVATLIDRRESGQPIETEEQLLQIIRSAKAGPTPKISKNQPERVKTVSRISSIQTEAMSAIATLEKIIPTLFQHDQHKAENQSVLKHQLLSRLDNLVRLVNES